MDCIFRKLVWEVIFSPVLTTTYEFTGNMIGTSHTKKSYAAGKKIKDPAIKLLARSFIVLVSHPRLERGTL